MNIIAAGYSGTGSSALVHLLSEYENVTPCVQGSYEHVLFYIPDGLFDLEDRLLNNNSIHMSDGAINRFYNAMKRLNDNNYGWFGGYKQRFANQFMDSVELFINELTQFILPGYWSEDFEYSFSIDKVITDLVKYAIGRPVHKYGYKIEKRGDGIVRYSFVTPDQFYSAARAFVRRYLQMVSHGTSGDMVLDQILLPHNLFRMKHYFDDTKAIVLDRDPRDLYVLSKYVWPQITGSAQLFPDVPEKFVDFYRGLKSAEKKELDSNILRLDFEELVYNYEATVEKIENFLGYSSNKHISPRKRFIPEKSINNTQNFLIEKDWEEEVEYIQNNLSDMLYDFPYRKIPRIDDTSDPQ